MTVTRYVYGADLGEVPLGAALEAGEDLGGTRLDWRAVVASAGFDPDDHEISITRLTDDWRGHANGSLVVTECTVEGHSFVVVEATRCDRCDRGMTGAEYSLGWPIPALGDGASVCPDCYGDDAFCTRCGALLDGHSESDRCGACDDVAP